MPVIASTDGQHTESPAEEAIETSENMPLFVVALGSDLQPTRVSLTFPRVKVKLTASLS
jgi:hypothetical protein